jgi:hypothetical protein
MTETGKFREKWPWQGEFLRLMLIVPSVMGLAATAVLYPLAGPHALWFLSAIFAGVVMYGVYGAVGRKVTALASNAEDASEDYAQALLVIGGMQAPGIAIMREDELELRAIVGSPEKIDLAAELEVREGRYLPGKFLWGKRAFTFLKAPNGKRLAFAVPESVGSRWSQRIQGKGS